MPQAKEDRRIRLTKRLLKDSLINLLTKKNISKITIKEICEDADINRATFYAHFANQYDLLKSIEEDFIANILSDLTHQPKSHKNTLILAERILTYIYTNVTLSKILLSDRGDVNFQKRIIGLVHENLLADLASVTPKDTERADFISAYAISGAIGIIQKWFDNDLNKSPLEVAKLIAELTMSSLNTIHSIH
jgi:AcrR family transcriptional regulator